MSSHAKPFYLSLIIFFTLISIQNAAQTSCSCSDYAKLKDKYSKEIIETLLASANIICQARAYERMANTYSENGIYDTAELYFQKAEKLYKQTNCGDSILITTYKLWAQLYYNKSDFVKTQEYCFKLLQAAEVSGNAYELAIAYTMVAQLFNQTGQADKGILYIRKVVPLIPKIEDPIKTADIFFKLSKRYLWHYQDTKTAGSLDSSELFSYQQLAIAKKINNKKFLSAAFSNLEGVAYERKNFQQALEFLDSSFKYTESNNDGTLGTNYYDKADIFIELKNYTEAARMADSSLYYRKISGNPVYTAETYELLSRIGEESNDFKKAYEYKEIARVILDSVRNTETTKTVAELEKKYNQAKNEKTIKELAQQKRIYLLLTIAACLAIISFGFYLRQQSLKHKQKILEAEQRLNRARMNPHFFFNSLASLQAFALKENNKIEIVSNLSKFSHIMRETLESTYKEYITIEEEIEFLNEYLELQKLRFPQKFLYEITIDPNLEADELMIPSMILQPFVENSIEHGFTGIDYPGHITICFCNEKNELSIKIKDNGKGLGAKEKDNNHISRASQIIKDRLYLLNVKRKAKARFSINKNEEGKGVLVQVHLPLIDKHEITARR